MAYYYSASERAFFSSELMSTDAMPSDEVAVADQAYKQLMADQVAGKLIRTGSGNSPESVDQGLTAATRFGDVSFGKVTGTNLDINGNGDVSGTFVVGGAVTIKGSLNAQGGLNVTSITATGTSTLAAVNATHLSLSGTLKVNGSSTLQAVAAKKIGHGDRSQRLDGCVWESCCPRQDDFGSASGERRRECRWVTEIHWSRELEWRRDSEDTYVCRLGYITCKRFVGLEFDSAIWAFGQSVAS